MPLYKITTQSDDEGRYYQDLGYIAAKNESQAVVYLYKQGIRPYYNFKVEKINIDNSFTDNTYIAVDTNDYIVTAGDFGSYTVKLKADVEKKRLEVLKKVIDQLKESGYTESEIKEHLKSL